MGVRNCVVDSDAGAVEITVLRSQQCIYYYVSYPIPSTVQALGGQLKSSNFFGLSFLAISCPLAYRILVSRFLGGLDL